MNQVQNSPSHPRRMDDKPWYKQFWPWFIIVLPLTSVVGSFTVLWLAISNPDHEVLSAEQYQELNKGLKAQVVEPVSQKQKTGQQDSAVN